MEETANRPAEETTPRIVQAVDQAQTSEGVGVQVQVLGRWTAARLAEPRAWASVNTALDVAMREDPARLTWDLRDLQRLDHTGAQLMWNTWGRQWPASVQMLPAQRSMFERVARYTIAVPVAPPLTWVQRLVHTLWQRFVGLGNLVLHALDHTRDLVALVGQLLLDLMRLARSPLDGPWRDVSGHLYRIGATAMPITALVGFLIGVVLAYLISQQLRQFGADAFIVDVLGISLIRELGPVLAAILLAGRSGSAITAQIGVMRVTEELDAMQVMGIARGYRLVMPRAIAMAIAMPLISVWTTVAALLGGMMAATAAMGITPSYFINSLPGAVQVANLWLATSKSVVFGLLIALVASHFGLRVKPNTESLGQGTTASVVTSITVVILVDALFAVLFKSIGI